MATANLVASSSTRSRNWSNAMVAMMIVGYAGYYLCRSHFSVAKPLILEEYRSVGITKQTLGDIAATGTLFYAFGKFVFGGLADLFEGRRMFLLGMIGAILATVVFGAGGPPLFLAAWVGNRFIQASGWVGMVKLTSRWFPHNRYGRVMGAISLSYLFGDFLSRLFLSELIAHKFSWHSVFYISAGVLAVILVPSILIVRDRPSDRDLPEPEESPEALARTTDEERPSLRSVLWPLLKSPSFWIVCALSFSFTFMRETFNDWTPTYLHEVGKLSTEDAGRASSLFPLFGGISVLIVGFLSDKFGRVGRALLLGIGLAVGAVGLFLLGGGNFNSQPGVLVAVVAGTGFVLIGPYSLLAGAISLGFGGKRACATAAGWIDGVGYIGGILSGHLIGEIAEHRGWNPAFQLLAVTAGVSCLLAIAYFFSERSRP